jgi:Holliday junction DNA helicase RuvA
MISALTGEIRSVDEDRVHVAVGALVFELLIPAVDVAELGANLGEEVTLHTWLYLQGDASGGSIEPRLIGFLRPGDKRFFEKFITVKGIGPKTALRALTVPVGEIAQAIEEKNARYLVQLDGIGKRTAELMIAELSGKVGQFASPTTATVRTSGTAHRTPIEEDAVAALMALGEKRLEAEHLLDRARQSDPGLSSTAALMREMLRLRTART